MLVGAELFQRPWMLLTHMFLHGDPSHLFFNMYALLMFGPVLESRIGWKRFLFIYLLSGLLAGFFSSFYYKSALGASGAIMGMLGVTIMLLPDLQVLMFFFIPMSLRTAGIIFAAMDIFGLFAPTGVGNLAHLVGLACGLLYGALLLKQKTKFYRGFEVKFETPRPSRKHKDEYEMSKEDMDNYMKYGRL
jgi:hypothetical protein